MNFFAIISSLLLLTASVSYAQGPDPEEGGAPIPDEGEPPIPEELVEVRVSSNAADVKWFADPAAKQYMVKVKPIAAYDVGVENVTIHNQTTQGPNALFGGLMPNTDYLVNIASADENGTIYNDYYASLYFKTLVPGVTNLKVVHAGENLIELSWDQSEYAIGYSVVVKNATHDLIHPDITVFNENPSAVIRNLDPISYYHIYVIAITPNDDGDASIIEARTDGSGIKVHLWYDHEENVHGGQVEVYRIGLCNNVPCDFRPMQVPAGPYTVKLNFGCAVASVQAWNAKFLIDVSDLPTGMAVLQQRKHWQKEKSFIGVIFNVDMYYALEHPCEITEDSVTILFGKDALEEAGIESMPTVNTDCPVDAYEWRNTKKYVVHSVGIVKIQLRDLYNETGVEEPEYPKPEDGHFIIAVNSGEGCPGGLIVDRPWSMVQKSSEGMVGATPQMNYFVQTAGHWYSNEPGFVYGYDPEVCGDRSGITAQIMINGAFVKAVLNAEDVVPAEYN